MRYELFGGPMDGLVLTLPYAQPTLQLPVPGAATLKPHDGGVRSSITVANYQRHEGQTFHYVGQHTITN